MGGKSGLAFPQSAAQMYCDASAHQGHGLHHHIMDQKQPAVNQLGPGPADRRLLIHAYPEPENAALFEHSASADVIS